MSSPSRLPRGKSLVARFARRGRRLVRRVNYELDVRVDDRRARHHAVDTSQLETVSLVVGPYRNLTTLVTTLLALHPQCQVLNHAWARVLRHRQVDIFADPRPEVLDAFARYAIALSDGGKQGDYGGSILLSHAFEREVARERYHARYGEQRIKPMVRCLVWKESMLVANRLRSDAPLDRLLELPALRLLHPVRDPIDCAYSNLSTGHVRHLGARGRDIDSVLDAILDELEWFCALEARRTDRCFLLIEDEVDAARLRELAAFHQLDADEQWLDDAQAVYRLSSPYPVPAHVLAAYRRRVDERFEPFPRIKAALHRLAERHPVE
jgi:hypothetical protein